MYTFAFMFHRGCAACVGPCRHWTLGTEKEFLILYPSVPSHHRRTGFYSRANNELYTQNTENQLLYIFPLNLFQFPLN